MLILIYKKENKVGYKTAKRRFSIEIRNLAISMIVVNCGGDPKLFFRHKKKWPEFLPTIRGPKPPLFFCKLRLESPTHS